MLAAHAIRIRLRRPSAFVEEANRRDQPEPP
jgi:hypothetical protein